MNAEFFIEKRNFIASIMSAFLKQLFVHERTGNYISSLAPFEKNYLFGQINTQFGDTVRFEFQTDPPLLYSSARWQNILKE